MLHDEVASTRRPVRAKRISIALPELGLDGDDARLVAKVVAAVGAIVIAVIAAGALLGLFLRIFLAVSGLK